MGLPLFKDNNTTLQLMQQKWKFLIDPLIANTITQGLQLTNIILVATTPLQINHNLGRVQQGYFITSQNANAVIWMTSTFNAQTFTLESSADVTLNVWVY